MSEPLKPCPFCEGEVTLDHDGNTQWISCTKCSYESCFIVDNFWNTRPIEDALRDEIAVLKSKLQISEGRIEDMIEVQKKYMIFDLSKHDGDPT